MPVLQTALLTELDALPDLLVVDLGDVTWFGVSGLITLLDVQEVADVAGASLRIGGAARSVRRLVEVAGLTERFTRRTPAVAAADGQGGGPDRR